MAQWRCGSVWGWGWEWVSEVGVRPAARQPGVSLGGSLPCRHSRPSYFQRMNKLHRSKSTVGFPLLISFFLFIFHVLFLLWRFFFFSFFFFLLLFPGQHTQPAALLPPCLGHNEHFSATPAGLCPPRPAGARVCIACPCSLDGLSPVGAAGDLTRWPLDPEEDTEQPTAPLRGLRLRTPHSPLMRIPPNYVSGCRAERRVLGSRSWDVTVMLMEAGDQ